MRSGADMAYKRAFTIVELLIVVVVIGILAAITIVSYSNVTTRATIATMQSDLENAKKQVEIYYIQNGSYPTANNCPNPGATEVCLKASGGNVLYYVVNNSGAPFYYISEVNGGYTYYTTNTSQIAQTSVVASNLVSNLDASNYPGSGTTWTDTSGNGNSATLTNSPTWSSANGGIFTVGGVNPNGSSFVFAHPPITSLNNVTMEIWFKPTVTQSNERLFYNGNSSSNGFGFYLGCGGTSGTIISTIFGAVTCSVVSYTGINPNVWYQAVFTKDSSNINSLYVNGVLVSSNSSYNYNLPDNTQPTSIGGSTEVFVGNIGIARLYSRSLSSNEVLQNFNATRGRYGI